MECSSNAYQTNILPYVKPNLAHGKAQMDHPNQTNKQAQKAKLNMVLNQVPKELKLLGNEPNDVLRPNDVLS